MRAAEARSASRRVGHFIAELWMLSTDVEKLRQDNRRRITGLEQVVGRMKIVQK